MKFSFLIAICAFASIARLHAADAPSMLPRTILFVDDDDVLYRPGTIKRVIEFKKHSGNPVVPPDKAWEGMIGWTSVYRDPKSGKFQLWYQAYQERRKEDKRFKSVVCYAESHDGINWTKPNLGLFPFFEAKNTNIVLIGNEGGYGDRYCNSVLVDTSGKDSSRRYTMVYYDWDPGKAGSGVHLAYSPDGIRWTKRDGIVLKTPFGGKGLQPPFQDEGFYFEESLKDNVIRKTWRLPYAMSDATDAFYDPLRKVFVLYGKMWTPFPDGSLSWKHGMGRSESKDLVSWSRPQLVLTTNDQDPAQLEFHTSPVFFYNEMYFSLNQVLDRYEGTIDAELISSRDGFRWDRSHARQWAIPRSKSDVFDSGSILSNNTPILVGDEMRFYYGAYRGTAIGAVGLNRQIVGSKDYYSGVGLAVIPRDRFVAVGINPDSPVKGQRRGGPKLRNTIGNVTLKAMDLSGVKGVTVNANAAKGAVRVEVLDEDGYRVRGFSRDDAVPITTDGLSLPAMWKSKSISDLRPGRYSIRLHLEEADLYAVTLN